MVLGDILTPNIAEKKPIFILPIAFLYSTIGIFLALWIFPSHAALVAVFLTTFACMPLMLNIIEFEKTKEESTRNYLKRFILFFSLSKDGFLNKNLNVFRGIKTNQSNDKLLPFFIFLFIGMTLAFTMWFVVLPQDLMTNLFYVQINTIKQINLGISGNTIQISGAAVGGFFTRILANNLKVLIFCVLFSFIFGAGAIFILTWNSSVIGVAIGDSIRSGLAHFSNATGSSGFLTYTSVISTSLLRYLIHGIPEILAYFVGGLAGGLISVAVIKRSWNSKKFSSTLYNIVGLITIAIILLVVSAVIEITISPWIKVR